jgi:hypothetical protein
MNVLRASRTWLVVFAVTLGAASCKSSDDSGPAITGDVGCAPLDPVPRRIWRLSVQQYSNSLRDLLGLPLAPDLGTLGGQSTYAFFADETLTVDPQLLFNVNTTVTAALDSIDTRQLAACKTGENDAACAARFAKEFGLRAFRRPLDASEVTRLMSVYAAGQSDSFNAGVSLMVQALVQSPSFMFRSELGPKPDAHTGNSDLDPYEVATQLAYTFLDSTPDQELLAAAGNGSLRSADGVAKQVDRLLRLPAVQGNIDRITLNWFNVPQLYAKQKDKSLLTPLAPTDATLGALTGTLQDDMFTSTTLFVNDLYWGGTGGKVTDLLTSDKLWVNQRLATLFGLSIDTTSPDDFVAVSAASQNRAGMLTQPGLLWAVSDVASTSIVHRGIGIHNNVICGDPIEFPAALVSSPAIVAALAARPTEIEKSDYRLHENGVCTGCHGNIDPYGRVLEGFDPVGNVRTIADGLPVDQTADFSGAAPLSGTMNGPVELAAAILADKQFIGCAAQMISSYVIGRMIHANATCEVQVVRKELEMSDGSIGSLFRNVAAASFTRTRSGGAQ